MLYRSHLVSGVVAGTALAATLHATGLARTPEHLMTVWALTTAFALLPDLDTASVIQRWFFRCLVVVLIVLMAKGRNNEAAIIATLSLFPLVHRHRGWMHRPWAAGVVPMMAILLWEVYWQALGFNDLLYARAWTGMMLEWIQAHGVYIAAMVLGYLTHLLVDYRFSKLLL